MNATQLATSAVITCALLLVACDKQPSGDTAGGLGALAASAEGFAQAVPGATLHFPEDHGAHADYRIEWWYLTANLEDENGRLWGAQWTLFRSAQRPTGNATINPWQDPQVYMAHFAISSATEHVAFQRYARGGEHGGLARAGATAAPFRAWLDDWVLESATQAGTPLDAGAMNPERWLPLVLRARQDDAAIALRLNSDRPMVLQGERGFSRKHPNGGGSYYYSHPFLEATGELTVDGQTVRVSGQAWLDREWSSQFLQSDQAGWDWFALHLDSGEKLMLFRLRSKEGEVSSFHHGVLIAANGTTRPLDPQQIAFRIMQTAPVAGRDVPVQWRIELGDLGRSLDVNALHPQQWLDVDFPYWEGYVVAAGATPGESGRGYLEMVGYPKVR